VTTELINYDTVIPLLSDPVAPVPEDMITHPAVPDHMSVTEAPASSNVTVATEPTEVVKSTSCAPLEVPPLMIVFICPTLDTSARVVCTVVVPDAERIEIAVVVESAPSADTVSVLFNPRNVGTLFITLDTVIFLLEGLEEGLSTT